METFFVGALLGVIGTNIWHAAIVPALARCFAFRCPGLMPLWRPAKPLSVPACLPAVAKSVSHL